MAKKNYCLNEIEYSVLKDSDLNTISELRALFPKWNKGSVLKKIKKTLKGEDVRFVAKKNSTIIGHIKVVYGKGLHKHRADMTSLIVSPIYRRQGIATQLVKFALKSLPEKIDLVTLAVDKKNVSAIKLYKKMGFKQFGLLKKASIVEGKKVDNLLMAKYL